jgi:hypothetical protein
MGAVIFAANALAAPMLDGSQLIRIGGLVVLVALGLAVYVASLEVLGVARLHDLMTAIRQRV